MNDIVLTVDVDWAPDFAIDFVAETLVEHNVRATWFITHISAAVSRLRAFPGVFELGIHPNFLPGSSHGETVDAVLNSCFEIVPEATSMRTHALVQSTPLLIKIMTETRIKTDVSLFLPDAPSLSPVNYRVNGRDLVRIPFFWADDFEMERASPGWHLASLNEIAGLKVFDFHPAHIYLNSSNMEAYRALKRATPKLNEVKQADADGFQNRGEGARTMFMEVVEYLKGNGKSLLIRDIDRQYRSTALKIDAGL
jgi:hypothetical protein